MAKQVPVLRLARLLSRLQPHSAAHGRGLSSASSPCPIWTPCNSTSPVSPPHTPSQLSGSAAPSAAASCSCQGMHTCRGTGQYHGSDVSMTQQSCSCSGNKCSSSSSSSSCHNSCLLQRYPWRSSGCVARSQAFAARLPLRSTAQQQLWAPHTASIRPAGWAEARMRYSSHAGGSTSEFDARDSSTPSTPGAASAAGTSGTPEVPPLTITLSEALARLVDTAVDLVGNNSLPEAINVLKEGIVTLEPKFPNSPEIGELYNQVALLLYFQNSCDEAAEHAQISLDVTRDKFGATSKLTGLRLLRLATCNYGQGKLEASKQLLEEALNILGKDPAHLEGSFYMHLIQLAEDRDSASDAAALTQPLVDVLQAMKALDGADNMVVSLMLAQHNHLLHAALERSTSTVALIEVLFNQHIALLEQVQADSEELGITHYKLATFHYSSGMPIEGAAAIRKAAAIMAAHYPEDHDLTVLCRHRMGMLCAAAGDHKSAIQLLTQSRERYAGSTETNALAVEADVGLAHARLQALSKANSRAAALEEMKGHISNLAATIGGSHMLVKGANHYFAQAAAKGSS